MDELEEQDAECGINNKGDSNLRNNLTEVVTEEMKISNFTLAEEQDESIVNLINDSEEKEYSKEIFIP